MDPAPVVRSHSRDEQEERNFSRLFKVILDRIINMQAVPESDIKDAIAEMTEGFKTFSFPDMTQKKNLCAYIFRFAAHGAGLTRNRVIEAKRNSDILASSLGNRDLTIVSLGGGPGNDIVGLCSVLFECGVTNRNLNMTVVDLYEEWSICVTLVKQLVTEENCGDVSDILRFNDVNINFMKMKLPGNPLQDVNFFQLLQKADIILMVRLISLTKLKTVDKLMEILKENMKNEALLLYIDSLQLYLVDPYFDVLFQSDLEDYSMSCEVNERFNSNDKVESKAQIAVLRKRGTE